MVVSSEDCGIRTVNLTASHSDTMSDMSKYFYRIFTIIDLHFGAMQPCSSGLGMTLEASDFRSVRRLVAYSI